mgnify:CR=1 FL=1
MSRIDTLLYLWTCASFLVNTSIIQSPRSNGICLAKTLLPYGDSWQRRRIQLGKKQTNKVAKSAPVVWMAHFSRTSAVLAVIELIDMTVCSFLDVLAPISTGWYVRLHAALCAAG